MTTEMRTVLWVPLRQLRKPPDRLTLEAERKEREKSRREAKFAASTAASIAAQADDAKATLVIAEIDVFVAAEKKGSKMSGKRGRENQERESGGLLLRHSAATKVQRVHRQDGALSSRFRGKRAQ